MLNYEIKRILLDFYVRMRNCRFEDESEIESIYKKTIEKIDNIYNEYNKLIEEKYA